jgi:ribulose-phosphate 3-epimerase
MVTFHTEALDNDPQKIRALLDEIHAQNAKAGFVVKPGTAIEQFEQLLPYADMVLIMSVEPGFGGQSFMEEQLKKVSWLAEKKKEKGLDYRIEIDGGISDKTYKKAVLAGADTLVAGSYVFKNGVGPAIESLLS